MRMIDADLLMKTVFNDVVLVDGEVKGVGLILAETVDKAPAVDAVEVVRCKDCKWLYDEMDDYCCRSHRGLVRICENSFCSYGERKDGYGNG